MTSAGEPLLLFHRTNQEKLSNLSDLANRLWVESKKLWQIAGPSIFSRLAMFSLTVITQSFAGHLDDHDLAAISIGTTLIISITFGLLLGMASALETLCGQAYGAGQYHMLGIYLQRSWVVLFSSSLLMLPLFVFATPLLRLMGHPQEVAELTGQVALWLIPMHLSFPFQFTLMRFLQCQLKTAVIALVSGLVLIAHVVLSWVIVHKLRVGIAGIALTLGFSWWISVLGLLVYSIFGGCPSSWTGFSSQSFVGLWEFLTLSLASGLMLSITVLGWESMIPLGFFAATGVRVANELGGGNTGNAKFATIVSVLNSLMVGVLFCSVILAFPDKIANVFTSNASVIHMVNSLAFLLGITILLNCIQPVLSGVAVGSGWQALVAYINIGSYYVVGIPSGIILGWFLHLGIMGTWAGMISGTVVQTLALTVAITWRPLEKEVLKTGSLLNIS